MYPFRKSANDFTVRRLSILGSRQGEHDAKQPSRFTVSTRSRVEKHTKQGWNEMGWRGKDEHGLRRPSGHLSHSLCTLIRCVPSVWPSLIIKRITYNLKETIAHPCRHFAKSTCAVVNVSNRPDKTEGSKANQCKSLFIKSNYILMFRIDPTKEKAIKRHFSLKPICLVVKNLPFTYKQEIGRILFETEIKNNSMLKFLLF